MPFPLPGPLPGPLPLPPFPIPTPMPVPTPLPISPTPCSFGFFGFSFAGGGTLEASFCDPPAIWDCAGGATTIDAAPGAGSEDAAGVLEAGLSLDELGGCAGETTSSPWFR